MDWIKLTEDYPLEYDVVKLLIDNGDELEYIDGYYDIWLDCFLDPLTEKEIKNVVAWQKILSSHV